MTSPVATAYILGYGNPGRRDDGLGPALVAKLERLRIPDVTLDSDYQLNIEDGAAIAGHDHVLFVDAAEYGPEPFELKPVRAASSIEFTSHAVSPEAILAICEDHFSAAPRAWTLGIRGYDFDFVEGLTSRAQANLEEAVAFVIEKVRTWKETNYG